MVHLKIPLGTANLTPPAIATVVTYNTMKEYQAAVTDNKQMDWLYHELRALPSPGTATAVAAENTGERRKMSSGLYSEIQSGVNLPVPVSAPNL
jgi:hypothetical protein